MSKIKILPSDLVSKIAAGEVIERPASVVKELIENSLDAGSKYIIAEIKKSGKELISITDDGCGMLKDDAILSIERHSTSKISNITLIQSQVEEYRDDIFLLNEAVSQFPEVNKMVEDVKKVADKNNFNIDFTKIDGFDEFQENYLE